MKNLKENYVKRLRQLLEGEIEQAEVIIASKGFAQDLQDMIEKVGRLMNEDLGPVVDQMREAFGNDVSVNFGEMMSAQLQEVIEELRQSKEKIDSSVDAIATGQLPDAVTDMDDSDSLDAFDNTGDDVDIDVEVDGDINADLDALDGEENPLGREEKVESKQDHRKVLEAKLNDLQKRIAAKKAK
jgi:hypothetical protein